MIPRKSLIIMKTNYVQEGFLQLTLNYRPLTGGTGRLVKL
jgi:hypothetical protein